MASPELTQFATNAVLQRLLRSRNPIAQRDPMMGIFWMTYGLPYKWMTVILVAISSLFLFSSVAVFIDEPRSLLLAGAIFLAMWLGSLYAAYDAFGIRVGFSEEALIRQRMKGATVLVPWSSITKADFSTNAHWFVFRSSGHPAVRISIYRNGLGTLHEYAVRRLRENVAGEIDELIHEKARNPQ